MRSKLLESILWAALYHVHYVLNLAQLAKRLFFSQLQFGVFLSLEHSLYETYRLAADSLLRA